MFVTRDDAPDRDVGVKRLPLASPPVSQADTAGLTLCTPRRSAREQAASGMAHGAAFASDLLALDMI